MDLQEVEWGCMDWIYLAEDWNGQMEGACEYGNEPSNCIKCGEFFD